jgi:hypothetical protein
LPQDASTAARPASVAIRRKPQRLGSCCERTEGTSTDRSSDERPPAVTNPRADCRGVMSLVSE